MGASALKQLDIGDNGRERRSKSVQNGCYLVKICAVMLKRTIMFGDESEYPKMIENVRNISRGMGTCLKAQECVRTRRSARKRLGL